MRGLVFAISTIFIIGCNKHHNKQLSIAPEALPYVDRLLSDAHAEGLTLIIDDVIVEFRDELRVNENGRCTQAPDATPNILISRATWTWLNDDEREELIFHELGHCLLNRRHVTESVRLNGVLVPKSIMSPVLFSGAVYNQFRSYYVYELFHEGH